MARASNTSHVPRIDFQGPRFDASFNCEQLFAVEYSTFDDAGKAGL